MHLLFAVLVGVAGAAASIVISKGVQWSYELFRWQPLLIWGLPVFGVLSLLLYRLFKLPLDMSTRHAVLHMRADEPISGSLAPGILLGTCLSTLGGASVGKEAGAMQMGAGIGSWIGTKLKLKSVYKKNAEEKMSGYATATGMAAALAALFFAPLGAALFVMELSSYKRSINKHIVTIVLSCLIAFLIAHAVGIGDVITKVAIPWFNISDTSPVPTDFWHTLGQCMVIGVTASLFGALYAGSVNWVQTIAMKISKNHYVWVIVGGLLVAVLVTAFEWIDFTGSGGQALNAALSGTYDPTGFLVKLLLTAICLGVWFKGGEIMPAFCIGGLLGASCVVITGQSAQFGAALGAMTLFAAASGCPGAAIIMGCEIFGWQMFPWLFVSVGIATVANPTLGLYNTIFGDALRAPWKKILAVPYPRIRDEEKRKAQKERKVYEPGMLSNAQADAVALERALDETVTDNRPDGKPTDSG